MIHDCFIKAFIAAVGIVVICAWTPAFADSLKIADEITLLAASSSSDTNCIDSTVKTAEKEVEYRIGRIEVSGNWLISAEKLKVSLRLRKARSMMVIVTRSLRIWMLSTILAILNLRV